jgi:AraC-like DNA-binding protein
MAQELRTASSFLLSTRGQPPARSLATLQEVFRSKVQLNFEAEPDQPMDVEMTVHGLPGLRLARMESSVDVRLERQRPMLADGEDDICLIVKAGGGLSIRQRQHETVARDGDGVLLVYREAASLQFQAMSYTAIRVPYAALSPFIRNVGAAAGRCIPRESAALQVLRSYLTHLPDTITDPRLSGLVTTHAYDLMALALGAGGDTAELARERGLKAARMQAITVALTRDSGLTLDAVARAQGVSPRYVQMLFEEAGTTFTDFLLECRLEQARNMLRSPRYREWTITGIALETGFGDISYFNRRFKRRYGMTPSDMRATSG